MMSTIPSMSSIQPILQQGQGWLAEQVPANWHASPVLVGIVVMAVGIALAFVGARFARNVTTTFFVLAGVGAGVGFGQTYSYSPALAGLLGAVLLGGIGYLAFRFWVALGLSTVLALLVFLTFGYLRVLPQVTGFEAHWTQLAGDGATNLHLTGEVAPGSADVGPAHQWWAEFADYVRAHDVDAERVAVALVALAGLLGMLVGLLASRFALIVATSLGGTALLLLGVGTLVGPALSADYRLSAMHVTAAGVVLGAFLATSVFVQTLMTRPQPAAAGDEADEADED